MNGDPDLSDKEVARLLGQLRLVSEAELAAAIRLQREALGKGIRLSLVDVLAGEGILTPRQLGDLSQRRDEPPDPTSIGPYRVVRKIGAGGMGVVYLARDPKTGGEVAVKVLRERGNRDPAALRRFRREAETAFRLRHPNIVACIDAAEDQGRIYYVMEYCDGQSLADRLRSSGRIPWKEALGIARQISLALQVAHERGFIHRDIKPSNILLVAEGAKILDLGLVKDLFDLEQTFRTETGTTIGTPHYMSPEQAGGLREIDGRADIYSLGITLYHMIAGQPPFQGTSFFGIVAKHAQDPLPDFPPPDPGVPASVLQLLRKMTAKDPDLRQRNAAEVVEDLDLALRGDTPKAAAVLQKDSGTGLGTRAIGTPLGRARRRIAMALLAALVAGVAPWVLSRPRPVPPVDPSGIDDWASSADLLRGLDPELQAVSGTWKVERGDLVCEASSYARLQFPYGPPEEYDFRIEFTRMEGLDRVVQMGPRGGSAYVWSVDDWEGRSCGLLEDASPEPDSASAGRVAVPHPLDNGRPHVSLLEIRKDTCRAFLDGTLLAEWRNGASTPKGSWLWELGDDQVLGLGAHESRVAFHRAQVREISGKGAHKRPPGSPRTIDLEWGRAPLGRRLAVVECGNGHYETSEDEGGVRHARLVPEKAPDCISYLYFKVSTGWRRIWRPLEVEVEYFDGPGGSFNLEYDGDHNAYRESRERIRLGGTGAWKKAIFRIPDPEFRHRQDNGADFRLMRPPGTNLKIHRVELRIPPVANASVPEAGGPGDLSPSAVGVVRPGVLWEYYEGDWAKLPDFDKLRPRAKGVAAQLRLDKRNPGEGFGYRFAGLLAVPRDGTYILSTVSDDGSMLFLAGQKVVDNDGLHGALLESSKVDLRKGYYPITVTYFNGKGPDTLQVLWQGPGFSVQQIPATTLFHSAGPAEAGLPASSSVPASGLVCDYFEGFWNSLPDFDRLPVKSSQLVGDLVLPKTPRDEGFGLRFSGVLKVPTSGEYRFVVYSDDGARLLIDGLEAVDNDGLHAAIPKQGSATLAAGSHSFVLLYFQNRVGKFLDVQWEGPGFPLQDIPSGALAHTEER